MIRLGKPVQLLEWGAGTSTANQNWRVIAEGKLRNKAKVLAGTTIIIVELNEALKRENEKNDSIKVVQKGEVMTHHSERWGEVAMGTLQSVKNEGGKNVAYIEVKDAVKIGR
jgi:hypothetical protein